MGLQVRVVREAARGRDLYLATQHLRRLRRGRRAQAEGSVLRHRQHEGRRRQADLVQVAPGDTAILAENGNSASNITA